AILANGVAITNHQPRFFASEFLILRVVADTREGINVIILTDGAGALDDYMGLYMGTRGDFHTRAYDAVRADPHSVRNAGPRVDNCCGVNHISPYLPESAGTQVISAEPATTSSTRAPALTRPTRSLSF